jgi:hypothetical protein
MILKKDCLQLKYRTQDHLKRTGWSRGYRWLSVLVFRRLSIKIWVFLSSSSSSSYQYSCCSHLEHTASVKRFVSLQFPNLRQSVGHFGLKISPSQGRYLTRTTQHTEETQTSIHASNRIRTHDAGARAGEAILVLSYSMKIPEQHFDKATIASFQILSQFIIHHVMIWRYRVSILKGSLNNVKD